MSDKDYADLVEMMIRAKKRFFKSGDSNDLVSMMMIEWCVCDELHRSLDDARSLSLKGKDSAHA